MSGYSRRVQTVRALVAGSVIAANTIQMTAIDLELEEAAKTVRIPQPSRRRLLQVLHTTRALDSSLREFLAVHQVPPGNSLGSYLKRLRDNNAHPVIAPLPAASRTRFQTRIVDLRNRYMHEAGAFPATKGETMQLLSEMHECLVEVLAL